MDFFSIGDEINVKDYNSLVYLLRKFKRLNTGLKLGALTLTSDYGSFVFDKPLTSVGGNFIIESDVNVSSSDCLKNCFYSFVFSVIDVNTSGTVNKRSVRVTGGTGDDGALFVTLPTDLIESDEVILPNFELDIVFDEHEYYTPVASIIKVSLTVDKAVVWEGETATVTAVLLDENNEPLVEVPCNFFVNGVMFTETTDSDGVAVYEYTGTGSDMTVTVRVIDKTVSFEDKSMGVVTAVFIGDSIRLGINYDDESWLVSVGDVVIDWGDGTSDTVNNPTRLLRHSYTDGLNEHTVTFIGEVTSLGDSCFNECTGLTSIDIPSSVTSLGDSCFEGCTGLTSIDIPSSVTSLGDSCFNECTGLTSIDIPSSVTSLGDSCFNECTGLTSIEIPSSVTSLGDYCFDRCFSLVDYQLYWRDTSIIEYDSDKMPVNTGTVFTIPSMQRKQYINKKYPSNNLKTRDYDLYSTVDKEVIVVDETSTVTCTLTYNGEALEDETVSYTIRQGATVIDTGSDTTDSNGEIEIEYTGTSIGKINIIFTYDTLTETSTIYDTLKYDAGTSTDYNDIWITDKAILTRQSSYSILTEETTGTGATAYTSIPSTVTIDLEINQRDGGTNRPLMNLFKDNTGIVSLYLRDVLSSAEVQKWYKVQLIITSDNVRVVNLETGAYKDKSLTDSVNRFRLATSNEITTLWFRNVRIYGGESSSKIETSLSISSDKASYYTDESILLTGTLVDDDNQPLVDADVKVYRGASLVDTVSTDSTGTYEKSVTGLSAGSYSFKAVYDGDEVYQASTSSTVSVIVQNHSYSLSISSDKQIILTTESVTISGQLLKDSTAFSGQSVTIYDGASVVDTLTTDGSGNYSKTLTGLSVGVHTFKAVHSNVESSTISITVNEPTHTYSLSIASDKSSILTTESVTISGQLLKDSSPYTGQSVALYDGSTLISTLTTDSSGEYEETLTGLSVGTHTFKAVNSNAESSTVTVTVTEPQHDYSLSVASTKDILSYADSESATITATLTDNSVAVEGETLSYVIKHGSTTISTGSDTTDSNGQISFNYTSTGIGDVTIEVDYGILLQETYAIEDCFRYDDATSDKSSNYSYASTVTSFTHSVDHYEAIKGTPVSSGANYYSPVYIDETLPTNYEFSVDLNISGISNYIQTGLCVSDAHITTYQGVNECSVLKNSNKCGLFYRVNGTLTRYDESTDLARSTWYNYSIKVNGTSVTAKIIRLSDNTVMYNQTQTLSNIQSWKKWNLLIGYDKQTLSFKNLKIKAL